MARPLRVQFENAYYHITCRGNAGQDIFASKTDCSVFLDLLGRSSEIYQVDVNAGPDPLLCSWRQSSKRFYKSASCSR